MAQESLNQKYRGVRCVSCGQPIAVSPSIISREIAARGQGIDPAQDMSSSLFNSRCRACCKENFYKITEIVDIEGTPRMLGHRSGTSAAPLRYPAGLSRAANS